MEPVTEAVLKAAGPGKPAPRVIAVTGGRDYGDSLRVKTVMLGLLTEYQNLIILHGAAPGADTLVRLWADANDIPHIPFTARWDDLVSPPVRIRRRKDGTLYNAAAGPARNRRILVEGNPELVVAFPGGDGTADMVRQAVAFKIPVRHVVDYKSPKFYVGDASL